jgi:8-oxo-dGTP pyrophosphatase MutT (NUDIX family)
VAISPYVAELRRRIGTSRLLLPSVSAIVYGPQGEILLVRQRDGDVWSTPGGSLELDENPVDAVVRETWEETGLLVQPTALIGVFGGPAFVVRYENGDETQYVMSVFECSIKSGEVTGVTDEVTACRFISEAHFRTLVVSPWTQEVLPLCYARPRDPIIGPVTWAPPFSSSYPATV